MARAMRAVPHDFAEMCAKLTITGLRRHYKTSHHGTVTRWLTETCLTPRDKPEKQDMPPNFAENCKTMCISQLKTHYKLGYNVIARIVRENNLTPAKYVKPDEERAKPNNETRRSSIVYDIAANTLRRERFLVNPCTQYGKYSVNGKFWRVGRNILTPDELLEKAARYDKD